MALIDLGPDAAGKEVPQLFVMDLRSGRRRQLTQQSEVPTDLPIWLPTFIDNRTLAFYSGSTDSAAFRFHQVKTDGTGLHEISVPPPIEGARVVPQFRVADTRWQMVLVLLPAKPAVNPEFAPFAREVFLTDGREFVQVTAFDRADTGFENIAGVPLRGRLFLLASADPFGENPNRICQMFSVDGFGTDMRPSHAPRVPRDGRPLLPELVRDPRPALAGAGPDHRDRAAPDTVRSRHRRADGHPDPRDAAGRDGSAPAHEATPDDGGADGTQRVEATGPFAYPPDFR